LINELHATAQKYNQNLDHIPKSINWSTAADFTPFVLKQTEATRNAQLPKLSADLIDQALAGGLESPQLLNDKARSIAMLGQQKTALGLLGQLNKTSKSKQLINSINQNINWINSNSKLHKSKSNLYLAVQARSIAASNKLDTTFLPDNTEIGPKTRVKFLIFRKARATLVENPQACLCLVDSILDYSQGDLAALLLKGEALAALQEIDEALEIWRELTHSKDENIANKASELIGQLFSQEALAISASETPKKAILFFIKQHLDRNVVPTSNKEINTIPQRLAPTETQSSDIDIQQHQLQLMLNAHILEYLEARFRQRNRPANDSPAQKPGAIGKTGPKAG
jgi:tetratricopeptide (TPR) repeat protein